MPRAPRPVSKPRRDAEVASPDVDSRAEGAPPPVIGIDLGTTNSCVAVVEDGTPRVVPNRAGYRTTPSMVAITESGRRLVGHVAKRQRTTNPAGTVYGHKRLIGRRWRSSTVARARDVVGYTLVEGPRHDVRIKLGEAVYSLPEIASMVLSEMKAVAEQDLGREVEKGVVTVPAYFNDAQRQATKDAGRIAGLEVIRIINEPTAAALAYGCGKSVEKRVAVFDLGGGTFDISILEIAGGVFEVLASAGDTYLGGEDFDERIVEWLVSDFLEEHGVDLRRDRMAMQRLRDAAERAKIDLSSTQGVDINLPFIISTGKNDALHLRRILTRDKLETLVSDILDRCIEICEKALEEARIRKHELDDVVLVGGQTRTPRLQAMVRDFFGIDPSKSVNADEVVALGAAIQAAALSDERSSVLLLDVTPHNLGIMIVGGYFQTIVEKNTTIPTSAQHVFTTTRDGQTSVHIRVFQGDSLLAEENELLGEFILSGLRPAPRGAVDVEVQFSISADGILSVAARDRETGLEQSIIVTATSGLDEDEIRRIKSSEADAVAVKRSEAFTKLGAETREKLDEVGRLLPRCEPGLFTSDYGRLALERVRITVERTERILGVGSLDELQGVQADLDRILRFLRGRSLGGA